MGASHGDIECRNDAARLFGRPNERGEALVHGNQQYHDGLQQRAKPTYCYFCFVVNVYFW